MPTEPSRPDLSHETALRAEGARIICGVDEVGRGPLAGPVTAAAVILGEAIPEGLNDSKKLSARRREELAEAIHATADVSIVHVEVEEIDRLNILHAAEAAMARAVAGLAQRPDAALVDGKRIPPGLPCAARAVVGGDRLSQSIAAASIVAKCARDRIMVDLAQHFPGYGWETNAGYGTAAHLKALQDLGATPHHRRSFAPVHKILWQGKSISS